MNIQRRCARKAGRVKGELLVAVIATPTRTTNTEAEAEAEGATKSCEPGGVRISRDSR